MGCEIRAPVPITRNGRPYPWGGGAGEETRVVAANCFDLAVEFLAGSTATTNATRMIPMIAVPQLRIPLLLEDPSTLLVS